MNDVKIYRESRLFNDYATAAKYVKELNEFNQRDYDGTRITCIFKQGTVKCSFNHHIFHIILKKLSCAAQNSKHPLQNFYATKLSCDKESMRAMEDFEVALKMLGLSVAIKQMRQPDFLKKK